MGSTMQRMLSILSAREALGAGREQASVHLNERGQRLLNWLRARYAKPPAGGAHE
jgi:hypothetical protein